MSKASKLKDYFQKNFFEICRNSKKPGQFWKANPDFVDENFGIFGFFRNSPNFEEP